MNNHICSPKYLLPNFHKRNTDHSENFLCLLWPKIIQWRAELGHNFCKLYERCRDLFFLDTILITMLPTPTRSPPFPTPNTAQRLTAQMRFLTTPIDGLLP